MRAFGSGAWGPEKATLGKREKLWKGTHLEGTVCGIAGGLVDSSSVHVSKDIDPAGSIEQLGQLLVNFVMRSG